MRSDRKFGIQHDVKIPLQDYVNKKKPGSLRVPGCSEKLARLYLPGICSGPKKVKAVKPTSQIRRHFETPVASSP